MQLKAKLEAQVFAKQDAEQTLQTRMRQWESERSDMQDKYKAMDDSWKAKVGAGQGGVAARKEGGGCWAGKRWCWHMTATSTRKKRLKNGYQQGQAIC